LPAEKGPNRRHQDIYLWLGEVEDDYTFQPAFVGDPMGGGGDDDFDPLLQQEGDPDGGYWISEDQSLEANKIGDHPGASEWGGDTLEAGSNNLSVRIDYARRTLWLQAKTGTNIVREGWTKNHPPFDDLAGNTVGPQKPK